MTALRRTALAILALAAISLAPPALAAPQGTCVWGAVTEADRAAMIDNYRVKGLASLQEMQPNLPMEAAIRERCKLAPEEEITAGEILGAMIVEKGADAVLFEKGRIPRGSLDRAWAGLPEADREAMRLFGLSAMRGQADGVEATGPVVERVTAGLRLPSPDLEAHVFAYLLGRAIREAREAGRQ